jgi:hypothetical protein
MRPRPRLTFLRDEEQVHVAEQVVDENRIRDAICCVLMSGAKKLSLMCQPGCGTTPA